MSWPAADTSFKLCQRINSDSYATKILSPPNNGIISSHTYQDSLEVQCNSVHTRIWATFISYLQVEVITRERALLRKDMKCFHQKNEKKNLKIAIKNSAKCAKRLKGELYPAKSSALACACLGTYPTREHYSFLSVLSASHFGLWVSTLVLALCSSYFKPWLRWQVSLGGFFPRNTPDPGHLAAWRNQAPECPVIVKWSFSKSRYCLWFFCSTAYLDIKAACLSRRCTTAPQETSHQLNIGDKEPVCNIIQWYRLGVIQFFFSDFRTSELRTAVSRNIKTELLIGFYRISQKTRLYNY